MKQTEINTKSTGIRRLFLAFINSMKAFKWLLRNESAFKQEFVIALVAIPVALWLPLRSIEQLLLILVLLLLMLAEILNTAIEAVVDRIGLEHHELSGLAKDLGSAAVFIAMVIALLTWLVIVTPVVMSSFS